MEFVEFKEIMVEKIGDFNGIVDLWNVFESTGNADIVKVEEVEQLAEILTGFHKITKKVTDLGFHATEVRTNGGGSITVLKYETGSGSIHLMSPRGVGYSSNVNEGKNRNEDFNDVVWIGDIQRGALKKAVQNIFE